LEGIAEWLSGNKKHTPHHLAELDEESQQVRQAISCLPLGQRVVIVLYYINDLSLQEISEILEVPEGTVKSRLHYGRQALKRHLGILDERLPEVQYEFT
jgi:RNA polymerase sigma-70 factor (ECF subfamily)